MCRPWKDVFDLLNIPHKRRINNQNPYWIKEHINTVRHDEPREDVRRGAKESLNCPAEYHHQTEDDNVREWSYHHHTDLFNRIQQRALIVKVNCVGQELVPCFHRNRKKRLV